MAFFDEKTKGNNKEVMQKILQSAYDRKFIKRNELDESAERLTEMKPEIYSGMCFKYRHEDMTENEIKDLEKGE